MPPARLWWGGPHRKGQGSIQGMCMEQRGEVEAVAGGRYLVYVLGLGLRLELSVLLVLRLRLGLVIGIELRLQPGFGLQLG